MIHLTNSEVTNVNEDTKVTNCVIIRHGNMLTYKIILYFRYTHGYCIIVISYNISIYFNAHIII